MSRDASGERKVEEYYERGGKPLSIQEVERTLSLHPFMRVPRNIILLPGDIRTSKGGTVVGATPSWEDTIILTSISDQETVLHENVHQAFGLGEFGTRLLTPVLRFRENFTLRPRPVQYQQCSECQSHPEFFRKYGLYPSRPGYPSYPDVQHWILVEG